MEALSSIYKIKNKKIGLMFGPEASGLSNSDLSYSNYVVQIPSSPKFSSLNLSRSIIIVCYEIFRIKNKIQFKQKKSRLLKESGLKKATTYSPTNAVPSALMGLTSLFGMVRGEPHCYNHLKSLVTSVTLIF